MTWLGLGLAPALGYPILASILFAWDQFAGDQLLAHDLRYHRRLLWGTFWSDYLHSLPDFYIWAAAGLVVWLAIAKLGRARSPRWLIPIVGASGWIAGGYLTGGSFGPGPLAFALAGALVALPLAWLVAQLSSERAT